MKRRWKTWSPSSLSGISSLIVLHLPPKTFPDKLCKTQAFCLFFKLYAQDCNGISMVPFSLKFFDQLTIFPTPTPDKKKSRAALTLDTFSVAWAITRNSMW